MLNAETPATDGELRTSLGSRSLPGWREVRNYALQVASLAIFFGGGLVITIISPVIRLTLGRDRSLRGQKFIRAVFSGFAWWLRRTRLFRLRFEGCDRLEGLQGTIVAPNHPSLLDAIFLIAVVPRAVCIMRADLMRNPCFAGAAWLAGYITNDRGVDLIRQCRHKLAAGDNLLIFPEGTRTRAHAHGVNPFKSGFALVAVLSGAPIQTVLIEHSGVYLGKETNLAAAARIPIEVNIRLGEVFHAEVGESAKELAARLEIYFRTRLANTENSICLRH